MVVKLTDFHLCDANNVMLQCVHRFVILCAARWPCQCRWGSVRFALLLLLFHKWFKYYYMFALWSGWCVINIVNLLRMWESRREAPLWHRFYTEWVHIFLKKNCNTSSNSFYFNTQSRNTSCKTVAIDWLECQIDKMITEQAWWKKKSLLLPK